MIVRKQHQQRSIQLVAAKEASFLGEAGYIVRRAAERDARVVSLGPLLFFSTNAGDAWVLDPEERFARCLAKEGNALAPGIAETPESCSVEWTTDYRIDGDLMVFVDRSGGVRTVAGYPVTEIKRTIRQMPTTR
jgi:hypothetical protein